METNAIQRQLSGHNGAIYDACWDNYRREWLTAGGDGVVAAWSESASEHGRACFQSERAFYAVEALKTGPIAGTEDGELMLLDETGQPRKVAAHSQGIFSLTPIGENHFFCGGGDGRITRWNALTLQGEWDWKGATKIRIIAPSLHGILIGSSTGNGIIVPELSHRHDLDKSVPIAGHEGGLYSAVFLPQKEVWLTGGRDGHLRAWSKFGEALLAIPAHEAAIYRMVYDQGKIYTASRDKTVKSWDEQDLTMLNKWDRPNGGAKRSVNALCIGGTKNRWMLAAGDDRIIRTLQL